MHSLRKTGTRRDRQIYHFGFKFGAATLMLCIFYATSRMQNINKNAFRIVLPGFSHIIFKAGKKISTGLWCGDFSF
jgi:hypothetical protein